MANTKNARLEALTDAAIVDAIKQTGSINKAADELGVSRTTFKRRASPLLRGVMTTQRAPKPVRIEAPKRGKKCFIFSSAQNGTAIHEGFLTNLEAYAKSLGAPIHIAGFTYNKSLFEDHSKGELDYHERVKPYLISHPLDIASRLMFCGEMNTLPTAVNPLEGFEAYTRDKWGIFPHPRVQLKSIATMFKSEPKIIMTTGAVTLKNYVQKKAGIKAEFHHVIAAVLVEVDDDGDFFCRHLIAEKDGSFQDLNTRVDKGKITHDHRVEAITWGDIHAERLDPETALGSWGLDTRSLKNVNRSDVNIKCMLDELEPKYQFFHDVLDFRRRNHHNIKDPHFRFEMHVKGTECVETEIMRVGEFLAATRRDWCKSLVVDSNHDRALKRWLREADYKQDPINARFFLSCQAALYKAIENGDETFMIAEWAIKEYSELGGVTFLHNTDSFMLCGIEQALHGDLGANGARGAVNQFARMGPKANIAHHHGGEIYEGIYQAGHSCKRDMVFNRGGLSSWNPSHIVTLPNGKRQMITMQGSKWRA